jgi:hypothetical protein
MSFGIESFRGLWKSIASFDFRPRNPLDGDLVKVKRIAINALDGSKVPGDPKPVLCFVLNGFNPSYSGIKIVPLDTPNSIVITLNKDGLISEYGVLEDDFAHRLALEPERISSIIYERTLGEWIKQQKLDLVIANFQRIIQKKCPSWLSPPLLMEILKIAYLEKRKDLFGIDLSTVCSIENLKGKEILVGFRQDKAFLVEISRKIFLAKGGQSEVFIVEAIGSKKPKIIKIHYSSPRSSLHESNLLDQLHETFPKNEKGKHRIPGIQKPGYGAILKPSCIIEPLYDGDLLKALGYPIGATEYKKGTEVFSSETEKLLAFYDIIYGLNYCVNEKGLIHNDIKPDNVFYTFDVKTNKVKLFLGDFGSALLLNPQKIEPKAYYNFVGTDCYIPQKDAETRKALGKKADQSKNLNDWMKLIVYAQKCDIFSLGCLFLCLLFPETNFFNYCENNHPIPSTFRKARLKTNPEICQLIEAMVNPDPLLRPSISDVSKSYREILQDLSC